MRKIIGAWVFVVAAGLAIGALGALGNQLYMGGPGGTAWRTMSGDATITNAGVITIGSGAVTNSKLANASTTVNGQTCTLGSSCTVSVSPGSISLTSAHLLVGNASNVAADVAASGDLTLINTGAFTIGNNAVTTAKINAAAVTYAKIQNVGASSLLGNPTGSPATASEITLGTGLAFLGSTLTATGSGGTVTSITCNSGLTGGTITTTGTCALDLTSNNTWTGIQNFGEAHGTTETVTLTSNNYNAVVADCGKVKLLPTGTTPTVTLPNINPASGSCTIVFVTTAAKSYLFNVAAGGSKQNSQGFYNTRGTAAGDTVDVILTVPSGSAATWNISGDVTS